MPYVMGIVEDVLKEHDRVAAENPSFNEDQIWAGVLHNIGEIAAVNWAIAMPTSLLAGYGSDKLTSFVGYLKDGFSFSSALSYSGLTLGGSPTMALSGASQGSMPAIFAAGYFGFTFFLTGAFTKVANFLVDTILDPGKSDREKFETVVAEYEKLILNRSFMTGLSADQIMTLWGKFDPMGYPVKGYVYACYQIGKTPLPFPMNWFEESSSYSPEEVADIDGYITMQQTLALKNAYLNMQLKEQELSKPQYTPYEYTKMQQQAIYEYNQLEEASDRAYAEQQEALERAYKEQQDAIYRAYQDKVRDEQRQYDLEDAADAHAWQLRMVELQRQYELEDSNASKAFTLAIKNLEHQWEQQKILDSRDWEQKKLADSLALKEKQFNDQWDKLPDDVKADFIGRGITRERYLAYQKVVGTVSDDMLYQLFPEFFPAEAIEDSLKYTDVMEWILGMDDTEEPKEVTDFYENELDDSNSFSLADFYGFVKPTYKKKAYKRRYRRYS